MSISRSETVACWFTASSALTSARRRCQSSTRITASSEELQSMSMKVPSRIEWSWTKTVFASPWLLPRYFDEETQLCTLMNAVSMHGQSGRGYGHPRTTPWSLLCTGNVLRVSLFMDVSGTQSKERLSYRLTRVRTRLTSNSTSESFWRRSRTLRAGR